MNRAMVTLRKFIMDLSVAENGLAALNISLLRRSITTVSKVYVGTGFNGLAAILGFVILGRSQVFCGWE
ncbi:MAG: hypothetical protein GEU26_17180 [Nitrososphaeraceae archaeon]|nr:hypothetical protein [Nitrososphaeraceae archaeon]